MSINHHKQQQKRLVLSLGIAAMSGIFIAGASFYIWSQSGSSRRMEDRPVRMGKAELSSFGHAKAHQPIRVTLTPLGSIPEDPRESLRLKATVQMNRLSDGSSTFTWVLPEGAKLLAGEQSGDIRPLAVGEVWTQEILVTGVTDTGHLQRVKFDFSTFMDGSLVGAEDYFVSHPMKRDLTRARHSDDTNSGAPPKGIQF